MSIKDRIRRVENRGGCLECRNTPPVTQVLYPEDAVQDPEPECCPKCGRVLGVIIRVRYEGEGS